MLHGTVGVASAPRESKVHRSPPIYLRRVLPLAFRCVRCVLISACAVWAWLLLRGVSRRRHHGMQSHRTMTRVKSVSSPPLLLMFLVISMALAVPLLALAERTLVSGTSFYVLNDDVVWVHSSCIMPCLSMSWRFLVEGVLLNAHLSPPPSMNCSLFCRRRNKYYVLTIFVQLHLCAER